MTAPTDAAAQPAACVRRADWSDESNSAPDDMADASARLGNFRDATAPTSLTSTSGAGTSQTPPAHIDGASYQ